MARIELPCLHAAVRATHGSVQGEAMVLLYHRLFADFRWYLATHQGSRSDGIVVPRSSNCPVVESCSCVIIVVVCLSVCSRYSVLFYQKMVSLIDFPQSTALYIIHKRMLVLVNTKEKDVVKGTKRNGMK